MEALTIVKKKNACREKQLLERICDRLSANRLWAAGVVMGRREIGELRLLNAVEVVGMPPRSDSDLAAYLAAAMHIGCMYSRCTDDRTLI
jgi:hypothetical protein